MDVRKECEAIILETIEEVGIKNFMLSILAGARGIDTNRCVDFASYMIDTKGQYGGPYTIRYDEASDILSDLGVDLWLVIRGTKEE